MFTEYDFFFMDNVNILTYKSTKLDDFDLAIIFSTGGNPYRILKVIELKVNMKVV